MAIRGFNNEWSSLAAAIFFLAHDHLRRVSRAGAGVRGPEPALRSGRFTPFALDLMHKRRVAEVLLDVCLVSISYYIAYRLRFEGGSWTTAFPQFIASLPIVLGVQMVALFVVGVVSEVSGATSD